MATEINKTDHSFAWYNATQFFGSLNDNIFKLLVVYFLIGSGGAEQATRIQPVAQALNVLPFLLFLAYAGRLADRHSKRNMIIWCKAAEVVVMLLAVPAFWTGLRTAVGLVLFLMYAQSAFFEPNKYGIICELVEPDEVTRANGWVQALTFSAVLLGIIMAPYISTVASGRYVLAVLVCVLIAAVGTVCSVAIKTTRAAKGQATASVLFVLDIFRTLRSIFHEKGLILAVAGSAYFSFIGVSLYFCVIPYGMSRFGLTKEKSTYFFVFALTGIAIGSLIAGRYCRGLNRNRMIPMGIFIMGFCALLLSSIKPLYLLAGGLLFLMGTGAGMFIVPLNAYLQIKSPDSRRGEVIAACEFVSKVCTLLAIGIFMVLSQVFNFSPLQLLGGFGLTAVLAAIAILLRLKNRPVTGGVLK